MHRTKRPEDRNAIAVVDRGIQTLKKDLATRVVRKGGQWSDHFERPKTKTDSTTTATTTNSFTPNSKADWPPVPLHSPEADWPPARPKTKTDSTTTATTTNSFTPNSKADWPPTRPKTKTDGDGDDDGPSPFTARKLTGPQNKNRQHDGDDGERGYSRFL